MMHRNSNDTGLGWLKFTSFASKAYTGASVLVCIVCIGLYRSIQSFFVFLNWLIKFPYIFLEVSLDTLYLLDLKLSDGLVRFIGFVTPRSEFFTILLYLILSVPLSLLKILSYLTFFILRVLSFFPWFLQVITFAIFIPPLVYAYDLCSFIVYYVKIFYYVILGWFYGILKTFVRGYLGLLELSSFRKSVARSGRRLIAREVLITLSTLGQRFRFEQFGSISSSKVGNYYNNSGTFDLDKYFLGHIPFSVYFNGRYEHESGELSSSHDLIHNARFFYQPDRKSTRLNSSHVRISYAVFCLKKKKKPNPRRSYVDQQLDSLVYAHECVALQSQILHPHSVRSRSVNAYAYSHQCLVPCTFRRA